MVLWIAEQGPLGDLAASAMSEAEAPFAVAPPSDDDLFSKAVGKTGIVYLPAARLLDGLIDPHPDAHRAREAVAASRAPGVEVIVLVIPRTEAFAAEEQVLRKEGRPYVVLRAPVLFEEAAEVLRRDSTQSVWLPREGTVVAASALTVLEAVKEALHTAEEQGRVVEVPGDTVDVASLFRRAAELTGSSRVHGVWPALHRFARPVMRNLLGREPSALRIADQLVAAKG